VDVPRLTFRDLLARHAGVLLDAYGVLVDAGGALPRAAGMLEAIAAAGKPYLVVTNDASRAPEAIATRFAGFGLAIPVERVVSSGMLVEAWVASSGMRGGRLAVLGTPDSHALVRAAGVETITPGPRDTFDALVLADDDGYPFVATIEDLLSSLFAMIDGGRTPRLLLPNPDVVYPKSGGAWGFTAGGIAALVEAALAARYGDGAPRFERLGKPFRPLFERAVATLGTRDVVMVGDQLATDIRGAIDFGVAAAFVPSGASHAAHGEAARPTYILDDG